MSILNRPSDGLVSVLLALRRALIAYGPLEEGRLREACAPGALEGSGMARKTLTRWTQLQFFTVREGVVSLSPEIEGIEADDMSGLRSALLKLVLQPMNNPALVPTADDEDEKAESTLASDFSLAASWALAQDPFDFRGPHPAVEARLNKQRVAIRLFSNNTRWNGFEEWAYFLGVGFRTAKVGLVMNPYFAVLSVLDQVFDGAMELPHDQFMTRLAEALPVIEGGRYRRVVDDATSLPWRTIRDNEVSPSVSAALQTLVERKVIKLEPRSDAPQRMLLGRDGRDGYTFSHIVRQRVQ
jgi:hypothetical protein